MAEIISTIADLEACVGAAGLPVKMKIIDHLEAEACKWIAASPLAFLGVGAEGGPRVCAVGGARGFASVEGEHGLVLPRAALDDADLPLEIGRGAGLLFLVPGIGETLRANGRITALDAVAVTVDVEECFVHCAKALIRSDFWSAAPSAAPANAPSFIAATRFLALATMDAAGRVDISPKGDPAGSLIRLDDDKLKLAERPGNRLAFGYRNIIEQPAVALYGIIPGAARAITINGRAHLTTSEAVRADFVVDGKTPILATIVENVAAQVRPSTALAHAALWPSAPAPEGVDPSQMLVAHLKLNKARGAEAAALRDAVNRGFVASSLASDYKSNLY